MILGRLKFEAEFKVKEGALEQEVAITHSRTGPTLLVKFLGATASCIDYFARLVYGDKRRLPFSKEGLRN